MNGRTKPLNSVSKLPGEFGDEEWKEKVGWEDEASILCFLPSCKLDSYDRESKFHKKDDAKLVMVSTDMRMRHYFSSLYYSALSCFVMFLFCSLDSVLYDICLCFCEVVDLSSTRHTILLELILLHICCKYRNPNITWRR